MEPGHQNYIKKSNDKSINSLNKTKNSDLKISNKQHKLLNTQYVSRAYSKLEPKAKIEMIQSSTNKEETPGSSENDKLVKNSDPESSGMDYKRNSLEDASSQVVPKIEVSLKKCINKKRSHEASHQMINELKYAQNEQSERVINQKFDNSSLSSDLIAYVKSSWDQYDKEIKSNSRHEDEAYNLRQFSKDIKNSCKKDGVNRKAGVTCKSRFSL